ncbi:MAG: hypothetical protein GX162_06610 [Firmicutes bacterium]|nr:hypothetical protein [Bacillota bacterium]
MTCDRVSVMEAKEQKEEVKVLTVVCRKVVQEIGDLTIPAPPGIIFDEKSGQLKQQVTVELAGNPQIRTVTILPDKAINQGVVPVKLLVDKRIVIPLLEIPFQSVLECPGADPRDVLQKHDIQVEGFSLSPIRLLDKDPCTLKLYLILKVVVKACIVVARETILRIDAARPFC